MKLTASSPIQAVRRVNFQVVMTKMVEHRLATRILNSMQETLLARKEVHQIASFTNLQLYPLPVLIVMDPVMNVVVEGSMTVSAAYQLKDYPTPKNTQVRVYYQQAALLVPIPPLQVAEISKKDVVLVQTTIPVLSVSQDSFYLMAYAIKITALMVTLKMELIPVKPVLQPAKPAIKIIKILALVVLLEKY